MGRIIPQSRRHSRALTLVECLVASLLLAMGASAVMIAICASLQHQRYAAESQTAALLGRQLLEHVSALAYIDPDHPDYETLAASGAQGMNGYTDTVASNGEHATGAATYSRALQVATAQSLGFAGLNGVGIATVEVTSPSGEVVRLRQILRVR